MTFFIKYMMFSVFFSIWHEQNWKHPCWGGNLFLAIVTRSHLLLSCMNTKLCSRIEWWCDWVAAAQSISVGRVSLGVSSGDWNSFQCPDVYRGRVMTGTCPRRVSKGCYRFPTRILYPSYCFILAASPLWVYLFWLCTLWRINMENRIKWASKTQLK